MMGWNEFVPPHFSISGLVAQLGERSVRIREVEGSNPFRSTIMWRQKRCLLRKARIYRAFLLPKWRFFSVPKRRCKIAVFPLWIDLNSRKVNICCTVLYEFIPVVVIKRILTVDGYNSTFSPPIKRAANGVWRWPSACGNCRWPFSASGIWPTSSAPSWPTCKPAPRTGPSDASYMNLYREDRPRSALPFCGKHSLLRRTKALMRSAFPHKKSVFPNV